MVYLYGLVYACIFCWCGGIGRRKGLKILREQSRAGSSPATSTFSLQGTEFVLCFFVRSPMQRKFAAKAAHGTRGDEMIF